MNLNDFYYNTNALLAAHDLIIPKPCWLRDTFFGETLTPDADRILVEYKDEQSRKIAPVVVPRKGDVEVKRDSYHAAAIVAPMVAPSRTLTADDLEKKTYRESLYSSMSPEERAVKILAEDMQDLDDMISTREEQMAAQVLTQNALDLKQIGDDADKTEDYKLEFFEGNNDAKVVFTKTLETTSDFYDIVKQMAMPLKRRGLPHDKFVMGSQVAEWFFNNENIQKLLDNRRIVIGQMNVQENNGVTYYGHFEVPGVGPVDFYSYDEKYVDLDGKDKSFLPETGAFLTGTGFGTCAYQRVTFLNQATRQFESHPGTRIPHVYIDAKASARTLAMKSRPVLIPNYKNSCIYAELVF